MDIQTILLWTARLACPIAMGVMLWLFLRQSNEMPSVRQGSTHYLSALQKRRAALDAEITTLEAQARESTPIETAEVTEMETPTV